MPKEFIFKQFEQYVEERNWALSKENFVKFVILECIQDLYLNKALMEKIKDDDYQIFQTNDGFILLSTFDEEDLNLIILVTKLEELPFESDLEPSFTNLKSAIDLITDKYKMINKDNFDEENIKIFNVFSKKPEFFKNSVLSSEKYQISSVNYQIMRNGYDFMHGDLQKDGRIYKLELVESKNLLKMNVTDSYDLVIAPIYVRSLAKIWKETSGTVLDKNLRLYVKDNKIDKDITKSLINFSKEFVVYNNGITIVSEDDSLNHDGNFLKFDDFHIINGGQTTKLIFDTFEKLKEIKNRAPIYDATVLVKIILFKNKKFADKITEKITKATNQQKKIETQDFLANNRTLLDWGSNFNHFFKNDLTFSVKRNDDLPSGHNTIKLWDFIELIVSTFWWEPHILKSAKKNSVFNNNGREILRTINTLKLEDRNTRLFIYDLWFINKTIKDRELRIKKNTKKTSKTYERNMAITKILHSGRFLILNIIFTLHIFHNLKDFEVENLLGIFNSKTLSTNEKISNLLAFSKNFELKAILDKGKNYSYEKTHFISPETEKNLTNGIVQLANEILKKIENNSTDINWGGLGNSFGDGDRNMNIIKEAVNQFLVEENDFLDTTEPYIENFKKCFASN